MFYKIIKLLIKSMISFRNFRINLSLSNYDCEKFLCDVIDFLIKATLVLSSTFERVGLTVTTGGSLASSNRSNNTPTLVTIVTTLLL